MKKLAFIRLSFYINDRRTAMTEQINFYTLITNCGMGLAFVQGKPDIAIKWKMMMKRREFSSPYRRNRKNRLSYSHDDSLK